MIYGELVQKWRLASGAKLLKWPREIGVGWGGGRGVRGGGRDRPRREQFSPEAGKGDGGVKGERITIGASRPRGE